MVELKIESLSADRLPDKLSAAGISVYQVKKEAKNKISLQVREKDAKKTFAILRGSCYNVVRVRARSFTHIKNFCLRSAGLLIGIVLFFSTVCFFQSRVLRVKVEGSGAYLEGKVRDILSQEGISAPCALPRDTSGISARILSIPSVNFCALSQKGGVLSVRVEVTHETQPVDYKPLVSPVSGVLEELTVLRGTPLKAAGDPVSAGETLVDCSAVYGEEVREVYVIARALVRFSFRREVGAESEEAALAFVSGEFEIVSAKAEKSENGYVVSGEARMEASVNLT